MKEENVKIHTNLGLNISATRIFSKESSKKLAIICPGFLDSKDYTHLKDLAQQLAEAGFEVFRVNPIGTWDSEGDISLYSTTQYLKDIKSVLDFALSEREYSEVLLGGHSRGGQISVLYAAQDDRITKVLAIMPSTSKTMTGPRYYNWEKDGFQISKRDDPHDSNKMVEFKVPYSHVQNRGPWQVLEEVKKVKVPILIVVGLEDKIALPEDIQELYENANVPKKILLLPGVGHDYRKYPNCHEINKKMIENLDL